MVGVDQLITVFLLYIPRIAGALVIILVGVIFAAIIRRAVAFLLQRLRFDEVAQRAGAAGLLRRGNIGRSPSQFIGAIVYYIILLCASLAALATLGLDFLNQTLTQFISYVPRVLTAVLILILGIAAAGLVAEATGRALADVGVTRLGWLRAGVRYALIFIVVVLAATMLGIDVTILIALSVIGLSALALAAALAIGLGLRGLSQNIAASRYVTEGIAEGDRISVNGVSGTVEQIGHAVTTLRGPDGRVYLIPNAYFLEHVVEKEAS